MNDPFDVDVVRDSDSKRRDAQAEQQLAASNDVKWIMSDARGRRFVWRLLEQAGIYRSSMAATPEVTAFNEGNRAGGLRLLTKLLAASPSEYLQMQKEMTE